MKRHIEEEIDQLKEKVLRMGSLCEEMIHLSAKIFIDRDQQLAQQVFDREEEVNRFQMEIDEYSVQILALYQPEASDLRTILAVTKINAELERIADQAVNITQTTSYHLLQESPVKELIEIPRMATIAQGMLKDSLDAFSQRNVDLAKTVLQRDEELDTLKGKALNEMIRLVKKKPDHAQQFVDMILIAKNLEKIGDHATNIVEDVIFMVLGKDIRHHLQELPVK